MSDHVEQATESKGEFIKHFLRAQMLEKLPYPTEKFTGQTIIVTGANVGLGLEAARHFVRLEAAKVILACRSLQKGNDAAKSILESEGRPDVVEVWELDLASYESTKRFASRANKELDRLDVVVANAGVNLYKFRMAEKDEETITINVVSTLLLGILLLPKLQETGAAHDKDTVLTFVGSFVHHLTPFPEADADSIFEHLADERKARMNDRYSVSKTIELFLMRELAAQISTSGRSSKVIISLLNPGFVTTAIMRHNEGLMFSAFMVMLTRVAARPTEEGARTLVFAAYGGRNTHGKYLDDCVVGKVAPQIVNDKGGQTQQKLWIELSKKLEAIEPGVMSFI